MCVWMVLFRVLKYWFKAGRELQCYMVSGLYRRKQCWWRCHCLEIKTQFVAHIFVKHLSMIIVSTNALSCLREGNIASISLRGRSTVIQLAYHIDELYEKRAYYNLLYHVRNFIFPRWRSSKTLFSMCWAVADLAQMGVFWYTLLTLTVAELL